MAFCAHDPAQVEATAFAPGATAHGTALDVADGPAVRGWVAQAMGGIDIVVPNVGALAVGDEEASWTAGFRTDMLGTVRVADAAMAFLKASGAASIFIISSVSGCEIDFAAGPYGVPTDTGRDAACPSCPGRKISVSQPFSGGVPVRR